MFPLLHLPLFFAYADTWLSIKKSRRKLCAFSGTFLYIDQNAPLLYQKRGCFSPVVHLTSSLSIALGLS